MLPRTSRAVGIALFAVLPAATAVGCESKSACVKNGVLGEVEGSPPHTLDIPKDHVERKLGGTYAVKGESHEHVVPLSDADMKTLHSGGKVSKRASSVNAHTHEITIRCKDP
jgi:hypothetical protein